MLQPARPSAAGPLNLVPIPTPDGRFTAFFSERGLARLDFPSSSAAASIPAQPDQVSTSTMEWSGLTVEAVRAVLSGQPPRRLPPLDLRAGTEFQQRVWAALQRIDLGQTKAYGEIAAEIGSPQATRAVGGACGANPIPLLIPCHRVLAGGGKLGGFSGGLAWKKLLLGVEGVTVR